MSAPEPRRAVVAVTRREGDGVSAAAMARARGLYRLRRTRDELFGDVFGEPAWDMLLDLFIAHGEGREISVTSLCIASAVPATTATRWINLLVEEGLLVKTADREDARRMLVSLYPAVRARMEALLTGEDIG